MFVHQDRVVIRMKGKQSSKGRRPQKKDGGEKRGRNTHQRAKRARRLWDIPDPERRGDDQREPRFLESRLGCGVSFRCHSVGPNQGRWSCGRSRWLLLHRKSDRRRRIFRWPSCPGRAPGSARCKTESPHESRSPSQLCRWGIYVSWNWQLLRTESITQPRTRRGAPVAIRWSFSAGGTAGAATRSFSRAAGRGRISTTRPIKSYASDFIISTRATSPATATYPFGNSISVRYSLPSISGAMLSSRASQTSGLSFDGPSISAVNVRSWDPRVFARKYLARKLSREIFFWMAIKRFRRSVTVSASTFSSSA